MAEMINFPLSSPQMQAAERIQSQLQHNPGNLQYAQQAASEREHGMRTEVVNETGETEGPNVDQEGHLGAEHQGRKREEEGAEEEAAPKDAGATGGEGSDDLQGRFINLRV